MQKPPARTGPAAFAFKPNQRAPEKIQHASSCSAITSESDDLWHRRGQGRGEVHVHQARAGMHFDLLQRDGALGFRSAPSR